MKRGVTPSQTVGPFFHYALPFSGGETLAGDGARGERITVHGTVRDGAGAPVPEAMLEIWQADAAGLFPHPDDTRAGERDPAFHGFGRTPTGPDGGFAFHTVKPGRVPGLGNTLQAPHLDVSIFGRGLLDRLVTRIYFEDEASNADDPVLALVPEPRRGTLIARADGPGRYRIDIVLQGDNETVFFAA